MAELRSDHFKNEFKRLIGDFEAYKLLEDEAGRAILRRIHQGYAQVAVPFARGGSTN